MLNLLIRLNFLSPNILWGVIKIISAIKVVVRIFSIQTTHGQKYLHPHSTIIQFSFISQIKDKWQCDTQCWHFWNIYLDRTMSSNQSRKVHLAHKKTRDSSSRCIIPAAVSGLNNKRRTFKRPLVLSLILESFWLLVKRGLWVKSLLQVIITTFVDLLFYNHWLRVVFSPRGHKPFKIGIHWRQPPQNSWVFATLV